MTLSKDVIRFFPTFTLHDATRISNARAWMARPLGEQRRNLTKQEAALPLMSACCHDIGMWYSDSGYISGFGVKATIRPLSRF